MTKEILSQDDIDALLNAVRSGKVDLEHDPEEEILEKVEEEKKGKEGINSNK